ncbi:MAG: alpha/beta hydrolase [Spirulina sp. SIO3F2]|nr:alpha/beta hydrolase [Spirulina sp. SIO3F2]
MHCILIHGMGRTPFSMLPLHYRLKQAGHTSRLFGYLPAIDSLEQVSDRLITIIEQTARNRPYVLIGHSLGSVIIRATVPKLTQHPPQTCFFLAPPMVACQAARFFSRFWPYQFINGEMGQLLTQDQFMSDLTLPANTKIYIGTGGPQADWLPFGNQPNDGILAAREAGLGSQAQVMTVPAMHTFIMNSDAIFEDIIKTLSAVKRLSAAEPHEH